MHHRSSFALTLAVLPGHLGRRFAAVTIYVAYLLISVIPESLYAFEVTVHPEDLELWAPSLFMGLHMIFVIPVTTVLCMAAVSLQAWELVSRPPGSPSPLSIAGLRLQAVVFAFVAISWLARLPFLWSEWGWRSFWPAVIAWYGTVGWFTVNDGIFAAGRAFLLSLITGDRWGRSIAASSDETEPLLSDRV